MDAKNIRVATRLLAETVSNRTGKDIGEIAHKDLTEEESDSWLDIMSEKWKEEGSHCGAVTTYFMLRDGDGFEEFSMAQMRRLPRIGEGISFHDGDEREVNGRIADVIWTIDERPFSISPLVTVVIEEDDQ